MLHSSKVLRDMLPQGKNGISYLRSQKILRCHINLMCRLDWSMRCLDSWCVWEVLCEDTNLSNSRQDASPLEDQGKTVSSGHVKNTWTHSSYWLPNQHTFEMGSWAPTPTSGIQTADAFCKKENPFSLTLWLQLRNPHPTVCRQHKLELVG